MSYVKCCFTLCTILHIIKLFQKGGILADDMGLGKTFMILSLIHHNATDSSNKRWREQLNGGYSGNILSSGGATATLIICPVSVMFNWEMQARTHFKNTLRVHFYHGPTREINEQIVFDNDIIITSYQTLQADVSCGSTASQSSKKKRRGGSTLLDVEFRRVVLDEAHFIRNRMTAAHKAVIALNTTYRWCLTGTPILNRADDIYSLFAFLKADPIADYDKWTRSIGRPLKDDGDERALAKLRLVTKALALRRTKTHVNLKLPQKDVEIHEVKMFDNERTNYELILKSTGLLLQGLHFYGDAAVLSHYSSILECLLRLRQICCCDGLVPISRLEAAKEVLSLLEHKKNETSDGTIRLSASEGKALFQKLKGVLESGEDECAICMNNNFDEQSLRIIRGCQHRFCETCLSQMFRICLHGGSRSNLACPLCRQSFTKADVISLDTAAAAARKEDELENRKRQDEVVVGQAVSTHKEMPAKVTSLLRDFRAQQQADPNCKCVVFSNFTSFLDVITNYIKQDGLNFVRLDGRMSRSQKEQALTSFDIPVKEGGPSIFLISTKAGGQGLNLTAARLVYILDVWWNAGVEEQAMDRVHRIGQKKPVRVVRYMCDDSIEKIINELQESKKNLARGAMQKLSPEELQKMKMGDLKTLFKDYL